MLTFLQLLIYVLFTIQSLIRVENKVVLSDKDNSSNLQVNKSGISLFFERWFLSSNAKDIGVLYIMGIVYLTYTFF